MAGPSMRQRPVLIMAGGTGGHIFPGLAVAKVLRARGIPVTWLGADGAMETRLVPQHDIALDTLAISGLRGKGKLALLGAPLRVMRAIRAAGFILRERNPRAVVAFGGFASGPGGIAARLHGLPLLVHEQNRAPGLTNRILSRVARRVLTGFPGSFAAREEVVGNPVRAEIAALPAPEQRLAGRGGPMRVLVLGGSQGARALNNAMPQALAGLGNSVAIEVWHQCGDKLHGEAQQAYRDAGVEGRVDAFITDMAAAYEWADLVVCRSGASTLAELCAVGIGSVLVPFAAAVDDHQTRNADYLVERGAAELLKQDDALAANLEGVLRALAGTAERRLRMAQAARALAMPDAAERIADIILEEAGNGDSELVIRDRQEQEQEQPQMHADANTEQASAVAPSNPESRITNPGASEGGTK
ncbi:undecaprenyldiphospho-muramoylpentapeptide beta-N-acetylglucosaminyltransferase [Stenotrophomonas sp. NLF4-10]|uniref:undecaprenyldiphospho-muramoylpentapeptide beta-N-acetylglucosaminyltransferase n=1 Tax=Stenotrophomonas sp. NLF4-10 TaxID=2918754 RepID=UPI001EFB1E3B|nr:undecaprenyldiphospho-muramoylpentapeptide beta-N-acetylglucosaminyltransferase [Stenotrophomonas sp. NLF4-10]MCG8277744.1 undecaprenyldiphospho-muramoylpentapeptide beta-N-acetylglucosaminyltransferase [Stenotrophomonas sp. NLF4-10]